MLRDTHLQSKRGASYKTGKTLAFDARNVYFGISFRRSNKNVNYMKFLEEF